RVPFLDLECREPRGLPLAPAQIVPEELEERGVLRVEIDETLDLGSRLGEALQLGQGQHLSLQVLPFPASCVPRAAAPEAAPVPGDGRYERSGEVERLGGVEADV